MLAAAIAVLTVTGRYVRSMGNGSVLMEIILAVLDSDLILLASVLSKLREKETTLECEWTYKQV